jgi:hypothetical protein
MLWSLEQKEGPRMDSGPYQRMVFSQNLQEGLGYPFWEGDTKGDTPSCPSSPTLAWGYPTMKGISIFLYYLSRISWVGPTITPAFSGCGTPITWLAQEEGLDAELQGYLRQENATTTRNVKRVLERHQTSNSADDISDASTINSVTSAKFRAPASFRLCKCGSQIILCPSTTKENDWLSQDLCILFRPHANHGGDVVGRAVELASSVDYPLPWSQFTSPHACSKGEILNLKLTISCS